MAKPTKQFMAMLPVYLEWARCTTPMAGLPAGARFTREKARVPGPFDAAESLFRFESLGENTLFEGNCTEPQLLCNYVSGKVNRDWWTKEKGWWDKYAFYIAEEFLCHLTPECFADLFGHYPRTWFARHFFDNNYTDDMLEADQTLLFNYGLEREQGGFVVRHAP